MYAPQRGSALDKPVDIQCRYREYSDVQAGGERLEEIEAGRVLEVSKGVEAVDGGCNGNYQW